MADDHLQHTPNNANDETDARMSTIGASSLDASSQSIVGHAARLQVMMNQAIEPMSRKLYNYILAQCRQQAEQGFETHHFAFTSSNWSERVVEAACELFRVAGFTIERAPHPYGDKIPKDIKISWVACPTT